MPERIESTLLVVEPFKDLDGTEYRAGDRVQLRHRSIRQAARTRPELFRMEFETQEVDQEWIAELDAKHDTEYRAAKRHRDGAEERRQQALREELAAQERGPRDPRDLRKRYEKQEKERAEREKAAREEQERRQLEAELALGDVRGGFHFNK